MKQNAYRLQILTFFLLAFSQLTLFAQNESDTIRINPQFLNALDHTFSFTAPIASPITTIQPERPDKELLHQWVKDPKATEIATVSKFPTIINIPGLSDHGYAKDIYLWQSKDSDLGVPKSPTATLSGLDVNGFLYDHLSPEGRSLRKSHALCASAKEVMDKYYPISGTPLLAKTDTLK